ncbi:thermonuclease family protein [Candidatus Parcubacteria bacterium]|nr:thermonuclease family protein [Candidatus Parcubacteria bacterium]
MRKRFIILLILIFIFGLAPVDFSNAEDLASRLKGRILLQVESKGEAWYVNPDNEKRHYLGRPADAFQVMRDLGLGVSNKDFDLWNGKAPSRLLGKILLKVEDSGKAYYVNPNDLQMHYLGRPADAFRVMRELGLGIGNYDLGEISISNNSTLPQLDSNIIVKGIESEIFNDEEPERQLYSVVKVVDGDTVAVNINGVKETLRLIGIDTPETVHPSKPVQCFGIEASNKAKELLNNKSVRLESDSTQSERDKYGRLLRYVFLEDGINFNKLMISEGYAFEYTYGTFYKYQNEFKQAEREARENKTGLWADGVCDNYNPDKSVDNEEVIIITDCDCSGNIYNCSDYSIRAQAQAVYDCCIKKTGNDIHRLDADGDGVVCESLP